MTTEHTAALQIDRILEKSDENVSQDIIVMVSSLTRKGDIRQNSTRNGYSLDPKVFSSNKDFKKITTVCMHPGTRVKARNKQPPLALSTSSTWTAVAFDAMTTTTLGIPPTILESAFEDIPEPEPTKAFENRNYDIKIEVTLKKGKGKLPGQASLMKTITTIKSVQTEKDQLSFYDIFGTKIKPDLEGIDSKDIQKRFCMENAGPDNNKLFFGLKINSTIPYGTIKSKTLNALSEHRIVMRLHQGGFDHGVNWINMGFFIKKHPIFADCHDLTMQLKREIIEGWFDDEDAYWDDKQRKKITEDLELESANKLLHNNIPLVVVPSIVSNNDGKTITKTQALSVTTPFKFLKPIKQFMDHLLLHKKTQPQYIPNIYKKIDSAYYNDLIMQQEKWLSEHRNIQINEVPDKKSFISIRSKTTSMTLYQTLKSVPEIEGVYYDPSRKRVNASVNVEKFISTTKATAELIKKAEFDFDPKIKIPSNANSIGSGRSSKYHDAMSAHRSVSSNASSETTNSKPKHYSNPWRRQQRSIPRTIDFTNDTEFPPLPTKKATASATSTGDQNKKSHQKTDGDTLTTTTVQEAIADALQQVEKKFKETLATLQTKIEETNTMKTEMQLLREQNAALQLQLTTIITTLTLQANRPNDGDINNIQKGAASPPRKKSAPPNTFQTPPEKPRKPSNPNRSHTPDDADESMDDDPNMSLDTDDPENPLGTQPHHRTSAPAAQREPPEREH